MRFEFEDCVAKRAPLDEHLDVYRAQAEAAERHADEATDPRLRKGFLDLAISWQLLITEAEKFISASAQPKNSP